MVCSHTESPTSLHKAIGHQSWPAGSIQIFVWRNSMPTKNCACCGEPFTPRPQVPDQSYCSAPACQRERRLRWQSVKMQTDPDYRENQSRSQRAWLDRNPDYWRTYRSQTDKSSPAPVATVVTKGTPLSGLYWIKFQEPSAKSDVWIAEITPARVECPCKKDACKERT